jgi:hypothetical protein
MSIFKIKNMTTPLLKKFNHKDHQEIFILNAPTEFKTELDAMKKSGNKTTELPVNALSKVKQLEFILSFVQTKAEVEKIIDLIDDKLGKDAIVWFAYPKGTSKKYKAVINRDNGWEALGKKGFEPVRAVAIDADWSALRFRKVEFIKTMTRNVNYAMTTEGKMKAKKNKL